ncbi:MAG: hypothetical protein AVO35_06635 [Candidatus Aegiribacteria sp. MLS_C]|nr:MAG: hypothetical protein AVO35_06635 [Candidatus Aegiribacteria sp. MLS_C]
MMPVRIRSMRIMREGPLQKDLDLEPADLNLIYGRNETGKTYVVEAMISLLFRTGRDSRWSSRSTKSRPATVREWEPRGEIEVTGLGDGATVFTAGSPRIEDLAERGDGMPSDLSRLLVVRAGDTRLSDARDGVGDEVLRTYLSGKSVLDEVEANIGQETVKNAVITDGRIEADNKGLYRDRLTLERELRYLDELRMVVDENASLVRLNSLERMKGELEERLRDLEDARRHQAFLLREERSRLLLDLEELPSEEQIIQLGTDISLYRSRNRDLQRLSAEIKEASSTGGELEWLEQAREEYLSGTESEGRELIPASACRYLALLFLLMAGAGAFFGRALTLAGTLLAAACLVYLLWSRGKRPSPAETEIRRAIEREFQRRFGRELTDTATLKMVLRELESERIRSATAVENRDRTAEEVEGVGKRVEGNIYILAGREVPPDEWDVVLDGFRASRKKLQEELASVDGVIATLGVPLEESFPQPSTAEWDQRAYIDVRERLAAVNGELDRERKGLEELKVDISVATGLNSRDIRELITALEDRRRQLAEEHRLVTARILAGNTVYRTICQYREQENARLGQALESPEIVNPLRMMTGRYNGIRMTDDGDLYLKTDGRGEYPLHHLSTGAAEQVYMALRTGFASLSFGEPAFLLLDDAFQHSDWDRRKNLVDQVTSMVEDGWQVFYFTMDEHLRKLFDGRGMEMGSGRYRYLSLD